MKFFIKKTPVRLQIDPIECGAVCLGIILEHFGTFVPGAQLRDLAQVSLSGASAKGIIEAAASLNLLLKAQKLLPSDIKKLATPAILFFDQCHFVVLEGYFFGHFYINDPALGRYKLDNKSFRKRFSRVAITIAQKMPKSKKVGTRVKNLESKLMFLVLGIFSGLLFATLSAFLGLMLSGGELFFTPLFLVGSLFMILGLAFFAQALFLQAILNFSKSLQPEQLLHGLRRVPHDFFNNLPFNNFAHSFMKLFLVMSHQAKTTARYFFVGFLVVLMLALGLILPQLLAVLLCTQAWFFMKLLTTNGQKPFKLSLMAYEHVMGQEELMLDGLMKQELSFFKEQQKLPVSLCWLALLLLLSLAFLVGHAWRLGEITLSEILAIELLLLGSLWSMVNLTIREERGLEDLLALKREITCAHKKTSTSKLTLKQGDFLGLVVFGQPFSLVELIEQNEQKIGIINDESELFLGTLKDNLSLFLEVQESDLIKALELSCATDLFYNRPLGLLTPIWSGGKNLSLSEKKRLLLAQALLHKPEILLLEDFFATLDEKTALRIIDNLKNLKLAVVFSSYRQKELEQAQKVIFIDENTKEPILMDHQALLKNQAYRSLSG